MTSADHQGAHATPESGSGLDYRAAGVDIEAGDALVERIKPLAKATGRAGVMGAGIRHQAIAAIRPGRLAPVRDDRMPLDPRIDRQAIDGQ